ncbi:MAG: methyltransferase domain-containing protein [Pseudomonadota bacterium]
MPQPETFARDAFLFAHTARELMSRLDLLAVMPERIVDVGAHDTQFSQQLAAHYKAAQITAVEPWQQLLPGSQTRRWPWQKRRIQPSSNVLTDLPLADHSAQMAVANLSLVRYAEPDAVLNEIARVLQPGGAFLMATLGPDTLRELRDAWQSADAQHAHVATFTDMHDVGDALVRNGFAEPVLDVERLTLRYTSVDALWRDLGAHAARNRLPDARKGLTGKNTFSQMTQNLQNDDGTFEISVEVVYAQSWGQERRSSPDPSGDIRISPTSIRRRV